MAGRERLLQRGDSGFWSKDGRNGAGRWVAAAALLLLLLFLAGIYAWRTGVHPDQLALLGYPGVFLAMFINGASILFPVPGQAAVIAGGALWNPLLVGLAAGIGNATGELTNYLVGRAAGTLVREESRPRLWLRLHDWLSRYGFLTVLTIAAVPNPIFDAVSLVSGSLGYPARRFWLACLLGNCVKYTILAYLGDTTVLWFSGL